MLKTDQYLKYMEDKNKINESIMKNDYVTIMKKIFENIKNNIFITSFTINNNGCKKNIYFSEDKKYLQYYDKNKMIDKVKNRISLLGFIIKKYNIVDNNVNLQIDNKIGYVSNIEKEDYEFYFSESVSIIKNKICMKKQAYYKEDDLLEHEILFIVKNALNYDKYVIVTYYKNTIEYNYVYNNFNNIKNRKSIRNLNLIMDKKDDKIVITLMLNNYFKNIINDNRNNRIDNIDKMYNIIINGINNRLLSFNNVTFPLKLYIYNDLYHDIDKLCINKIIKYYQDLGFDAYLSDEYINDARRCYLLLNIKN